MCGIVAIHSPNDQPPAELGRAMLERIRHRGPDGSGERTVGPTWLGHVRLAIVDLDEGSQPLGPADGHWAVVNGEIYNHHELRRVSGLHFAEDATGSDSEAALAAAVAGDLDALADLRGMFAFVVAHPDGRVVAVRDPLGVKPLYWAHIDGRTLFASELVAFEPEHRPHVEAFPPGFRWTPQEGLVRFRELHVAGEAVADRETARTAIRDTLVTAVRRRMMADVPVGVFLSGGLDSSLVAAIMAFLRRRRPRSRALLRGRHRRQL
ncbi:MAG: asparagine synthase-related protein [Janibacter sp.]